LHCLNSAIAHTRTQDFTADEFTGVYPGILEKEAEPWALETEVPQWCKGGKAMVRVGSPLYKLKQNVKLA